MKTKNRQDQTKIIEAAGGILWRETSLESEICIVHRPKYDDWSLPKGLRNPNEKWHKTAKREVFEETRHKVQIISFAGCFSYPVLSAIKIVLFWNMAVVEDQGFVPNSEIDQRKWLSPKNVLSILTYEKEKKLLRQLTPGI